MEGRRGEGPGGILGRSLHALVGRTRSTLVGGGTAIARLKKADAERLLAGYDADPIAELTSALRIILEMPNADWATLLAASPIESERRQRLLAADESSLDRLAADLNESRGFDGHRANTPAYRREGDDGSAPPSDT